MAAAGHGPLARWAPMAARMLPPRGGITTQPSAPYSSTHTQLSLWKRMQKEHATHRDAATAMCDTREPAVSADTALLRAHANGRGFKARQAERRIFEENLKHQKAMNNIASKPSQVSQLQSRGAKPWKNNALSEDMMRHRMFKVHDVQEDNKKLVGRIVGSRPVIDSIDQEVAFRRHRQDMMRLRKVSSTPVLSELTDHAAQQQRPRPAAPARRLPQAAASAPAWRPATRPNSPELADGAAAAQAEAELGGATPEGGAAAGRQNSGGVGISCRQRSSEGGVSFAPLSKFATYEGDRPLTDERRTPGTMSIASGHSVSMSMGTRRASSEVDYVGMVSSPTTAPSAGTATLANDLVSRVTADSVLTASRSS